MTVNSGWLLTVLRQRGIPTGNVDEFRLALDSLRENQRDALKAAMLKVERGTEDSASMRIVMALVGCVSESARRAFSEVGINPEVAAVFDWMSCSESADSVIARVSRGDREAKAELLRALGDADVRSLAVQRPKAKKKDVVRTSVPDQAAVVGQQVSPSAKRVGDKATVAQNTTAAENYHIYGKTGALTIELDAVQSEPMHRRNTVRIEAATRTQSRSESGRAAYNWDEKIIFQLTLRELHVFVGCCIGLRKGCKFEAHGPGNDKWLECEVQTGRVFVKVAQGRRLVAVPIENADLYDVAVLAQRALYLNDPDLDQSTILTTVSRLSVMDEPFTPTPRGR